MGRTACVNVLALPLQMLLHAHPEWGEHPVAVVAEEKPQAPVLYANRPARRAGIRGGMRYAAALALCGELRAAPVSPQAIAQTVREMLALLQRFGPHVQPSAHEPGVFWSSLAGLRTLHRSPRAWAEALHAALVEAGWRAALVVGCSHFGTYALSHTVSGGVEANWVRVLRDAALERRLAAEVPLARLGLPPRQRDALAQLAVHRVGDLLRLPADGLARRFGPDLARLHRLASGALEEPLQPAPEHLPVTETALLEHPLLDTERLLFVLKPLLARLLARLAGAGEALTQLELSLHLDNRETRHLGVQPAEPTLEPVLLLDLIRLRVERIALPAGVVEFTLGARTTRATAEQLKLFAQHPRRDLKAGDRALARLRAELGAQAVVRPVLREGHLPEARFAWEPLQHLHLPEARPGGAPTLVRRCYPRPVALPHPTRFERDGTFVPGGLKDAVARTQGPQRLSGGWWAREVTRDYYFIETRSGELLWLYYDRQRRRWFLQGRVE